MLRSDKENLQVLFEDNHIIIVNKRAGDIVQGDKTGDKSLSEVVKEYIKDKYNKPGEVFLGVVHRIDRVTGGAVIFARTGKALARLNKMLQDHEIKKTYWAIVNKETLANEGELSHFLVRNSKQNKSYAYDKIVPNSKKAILSYKILKKLDRYQLLEINLKTGRHHQIRCQLSKIGFPIKGDVKYGFKRANKDLSVNLHARMIEFIHPVKLEQVSIVAPTPKDPVWDACTK
ncbi:MAG: RluA family pseudouridine synthase [Flavobacteriales bacterium]|nr:RluA family pseudouridine synthase [Flavobacteriales bacterium]